MKTGAFVWRATFSRYAFPDYTRTETVLTESDSFSDVRRALERKYTNEAGYAITLHSAECLGFGVYPLSS